MFLPPTASFRENLLKLDQSDNWHVKILAQLVAEGI